MKPKRRTHDETSFEGLIDFSSVPPPPASGTVDVYSACTAVAKLPKELLDELRRFTDEESPTAPGKDRPLAVVPEASAPSERALLAEVNAALAAAGAATLAESDPSLQVTRAMPAFAFPPQHLERETQPSPEPTPLRRRRRWGRALVVALAVLVVAIASAFAARRFAHRVRA